MTAPRARITDHAEIDWATLVDAVPLVVDTRNVAPKTPATRDRIFGARRKRPGPLRDA